MAVLDDRRVGSRDKPPLVVMASPIYSASRSLLCALANRGLMTLHELEVPDTAAVAAIAEREPVALIFCEVLTNPRLRVPDLPALAQIASQHGATLLVDSTLATPLLCRPLTLGPTLLCTRRPSFWGMAISVRASWPARQSSSLGCGPTVSSLAVSSILRGLAACSAACARCMCDSVGRSKTPPPWRTFYRSGPRS